MHFWVWSYMGPDLFPEGSKFWGLRHPRKGGH